MKYVIVLCDGMADRKIPSLNDRTPMSVAFKPMMNELAKKSEVGLVKTVPDGMTPGSDVANLSVMGYDPKKYYSGRSPLEAASIGIKLDDDDITFRCNLVTLSDEKIYEEKTLVDYCADDISSEEASVIINYINEKLCSDKYNFYTGISYRHCLVKKHAGAFNGRLTPPHDITGRKITKHLPDGNDASELLEFMKKSYQLLNDHPINIERVKQGKKPANSVWFWGAGSRPMLTSFYDKFGLKGSVISAVDLLKGIAICADMRSVDVEGATGYIDTDFSSKLDACISELLRGQDLVYIHLEAPDECGHRGELENKIKSIELIDEKIIKPLVDALEKIGDYSMLICPDHPTPLEIKTHSLEPVPYLIYRSTNDVFNDTVTCFDEENASKTGCFIESGYTLMEHFIGG